MPPPADPRSDQDLIAALNAGDASAFDALYYRYRDRILRLAFRFTASETDAQDVLQETFTYFYRKFPGFVLTAQMTTFLYPVVRNLSLAARRKRQKGGGSGESSEILEDLPGETTTADPERSRSELTEVMASLSAAHRQAVLLRFVDDLSIDEIAAATGVAAGTVKSRLHHAIAQLRADPRMKRFFGLK